jgi:hypothetical protein
MSSLEESADRSDVLDESGEGLLVRMDWVSASGFHPSAQQDVLKEVSNRVQAVRSRSTSSEGHPLVVLDLDSTLYEVGHRTHRIIQEWIESEESQPFAEIRAQLQALQTSDFGYSLRDTFHTANISLTDPDALRAWESAKRFWASRFFRSAYLGYDQPYPGAATFANELYRVGAELIYLTGRDEPNMGDGTRSNLVRDSFPWGVDRTHLLMKSAFEINDLDHKKSAAEFIRKKGTLIASFENEPVNLVALYELFPDAMHVFVDTVCSDRGAKAINGLYRVKGFD